MTPSRSQVTEVLLDWNRGEEAALERLMPLVVDELRKIARSHLRWESPGHTLQPTALVNELYLRLVDRRRVNWKDRAHFFAFAAQAMRRILVDQARRRRAKKRGGAIAVTTRQIGAGQDTAPDIELIALDEALRELAALDERQSRVVELRFFAGLTAEEIAEVLRISPRTVNRDWRTARLWLYDRIRRPAS